MRPLETSQRVLTWLWLCPAAENVSKQRKFIYVLFTCAINLLSLYILICSAIYSFEFLRIDLEKSLYSLYQIVAALNSIYLMASGLFLRHKISDIFTQLSGIHKTNENDDSFRFLARANNKSEWIWRLYFKHVMGGFLVTSSLIVSALIGFGWRTNGNFNTNYLYHPFKMEFPWNEQTPITYFVEMCIHFAGTETYFICNGVYLLTFISFCWYHQAFCQMLRQTMHKLDSHGDPNLNDQELLGKLVDFHNSSKIWFFESSKIYSPIILFQLICSMLILTSCIFQLDVLQRNKRIDMDFIILLVASSVGIANLFLYCFFGKLATESFEKMADCLFQANWQDLPIKLQKYFVLMIANTQQPLYYHGFHVAILNLRTFCAFVRAVCTYFMMFKTLTSE